MFCRKGVLRNFTKFRRKHLCQSLLFNKVAGLRLATFKKETLRQVFSCEFCEISINTNFTEHLWMTASNFCQDSKDSSILSAATQERSSGNIQCLSPFCIKFQVDRNTIRYIRFSMRNLLNGN